MRKRKYRYETRSAEKSLSPFFKFALLSFSSSSSAARLTRWLDRVKRISNAGVYFQICTQQSPDRDQYAEWNFPAAG
jgi:hypothetical protein